MDGRIRRLEGLIQDYIAAQRPTVFLLENGETFTTAMDPFDYLVRCGVETPKGRITAYPHEVEGVDGLSRSLYELIDDGIRKGGLADLLDDLESDMV